MLMTSTSRFDTAFLEGGTGGTAHGFPCGDRFVIDSRGNLQSAVFVAIAGPRFDGHSFVSDALAQGATGAVVASEWWQAASMRPANVVVVSDTVTALQDLARSHRVRHPIPLVAVTGSNGKTSTKEFLGAALTPLGPILKTTGNLNNHLGLPLTLLQLTEKHVAGVVEIGLNHPGELEPLARLANPQVGVITNVAEAHLEGLDSLDGVATAKAELVAGLADGGTLVLPHGSAPLDRALESYSGSRVTFGMTPDADVHPRSVHDRGVAGTRLTLMDGTAVAVEPGGDHAVLNALAALAAARALGVGFAEAAPHLTGVRPVPGRMDPRVAGGVTVLDDTYNANPASLAAALAVLERETSGRRWAILGDMLELGPDAARLHRLAGSRCGFLDGLITVGTLAGELGAGAVEVGLDSLRVHPAENGEAAAARLLSDLSPGDTVLVKGSRGMRLETAVRRLLAGLGGAA